MEFAEKKVFRKSFIGGFSKEDVNNYIASSAEKYSAQIKDIEEKYLAADKEREELSKKLREAEEKISELSAKSDELDALLPKYEKLCAEKEEAERNASSNGAKCEELEAKLSDLEKIGDEYTARKTELADIEIAARARASEIINEAEELAAKKRAELSEELSLLRRNFEEKKEAEIRAAADSFAGVSRLVDSLKNEVESMDSRITRIADSVRNNMTMLSDAVSDAKDKVSGIESRLSDGE